VSAWLEKNSTALIATGSAFLGVLYAAVRILWANLVESRTNRIAVLEAELKTEQREHWKTAMALERLSGKYERERAGSSRPPPSS
jgi:hypothetical protein